MSGVKTKLRIMTDNGVCSFFKNFNIKKFIKLSFLFLKIFEFKFCSVIYAHPVKKPSLNLLILRKKYLGLIFKLIYPIVLRIIHKYQFSGKKLPDVLHLSKQKKPPALRIQIFNLGPISFSV